MVYGFVKQSGGPPADRQRARPRHARCASTCRGPHSVEAVEADEATAADLAAWRELILLVEDDAEMRTVARRHLRGARATGSARPEAGRRHWRSSSSDRAIDLLFTDVVMPDGMTGHQLAAAARQLRPGLKVLFTSGYFRPEPDNEPARVMTAGAMIRKPYRRQELAATVRAALEA